MAWINTINGEGYMTEDTAGSQANPVPAGFEGWVPLHPTVDQGLFNSQWASQIKQAPNGTYYLPQDAATEAQNAGVMQTFHRGGGGLIDKALGYGPYAAMLAGGLTAAGAFGGTAAGATSGSAPLVTTALPEATALAPAIPGAVDASGTGFGLLDNTLGTGSLFDVASNPALTPTAIESGTMGVGGGIGAGLGADWAAATAGTGALGAGVAGGDWTDSFNGSPINFDTASGGFAAKSIWDTLTQKSDLLNGRSLLGTGLALTPSLLALLYGRNTNPIDTSKLDTAYNQIDPSALTYQYDLNTNAGRDALTSSLTNRGVMGSSFGNADLTNYNTIRDIGRRNVLNQGALDQAKIAQMIQNSQIADREMKNRLYSSALLAASGALSPRMSLFG